VGDLEGAEAWTELLRAKHSLTADWIDSESKSIRPIADYADINQLKAIALSQFKSALTTVLRQSVTSEPVGAPSLKFLGDYVHLPCAARPVLRYAVDRLNRKTVQDFLERPLSREQLVRVGMKSDDPVPLVKKLEALGCAYDGYPSLGALLCFGPPLLLTDRFDSCCLQMVTYSDTRRETSSPSINTHRANLHRSLSRSRGDHQFWSLTRCRASVDPAWTRGLIGRTGSRSRAGTWDPRARLHDE